MPLAPDGGARAASGVPCRAVPGHVVGSAGDLAADLDTINNEPHAGHSHTVAGIGRTARPSICLCFSTGLTQTHNFGNREFGHPFALIEAPPGSFTVIKF